MTYFNSSILPTYNNYIKKNVTITKIFILVAIITKKIIVIIIVLIIIMLLLLVFDYVIVSL